MTLKNPRLDKMLTRMGWDDSDPSKDIEALYMCWLYGVSLKTLAKQLDTSITILCRLFEASYGTQATNPAMKSLLRSMAEDYPDNDLVQRWIRHQIRYLEPPRSYVATQMESCPVKALYGGVHRSKKLLDGMTDNEYKYWTSSETLDRLGVQPNNGRKVKGVRYE